MADREHKIDFVIDAVKGSGFQSTFTKAQAEFTRLGREIQNVQRVQRDVSAYQRQQEAAAKTREKLDNLSRQYDLLQKEIEETKEANEKAREAQDSGTEAVEKSTTALEREALKLKNQITTTTSALNGQEDKLKTTAKRLEEAGVSTDDLTRSGARLTQQISALKEEQDQAAQSAKAYTESASAGFVNVGQALASAGVLAGLKKIADAYLDCVQTSAGFEAAMSNVGALSGASPDELAALSDKAKEMGAATKYTAQESAEAFGYMALAGWNSEQMLSGIAPVLNLAAASAMDLGQASDIVTDYLTAFGLEAKDAARFADQMAYAQAHSNTTTADLGEAYKNVAATAKSLGYSVEDTTAVLMAMANAGVKGGEAGSGLSTVMTRLATNTKDCADELSEFGVMVYDENGKMRGLADIIGDTAGAFNGLTDEEQANLAKAIAGTNQYSKFQTILAGMSESAKAGGQSITDYAAALEDCSGTAGKMAETMLDNLSGDLTKLGSAADAVRISLGEQFTPELRKLTQAGTEALNGVNRLIERNPAAVKAVTLFTGAMGTATAGVIAYSAAVKAVKALDLKNTFADAAPFLGVTAAIGGTVAVATALHEAYREAVPEATALRDATAELHATLDKAGSNYEDVRDKTLAASEVAGRYIDELEAMGGATGDAAERNERYQGTVATLLEVMPELAGCFDKTVDQYGRVTYAANVTTDAMREQVEAAKQTAILNELEQQRAEILSKYGADLISEETARLKKEDAEQAVADAEVELSRLRARQYTLYRDAEQRAIGLGKKGIQRSAEDLVGDEYTKNEKQIASLESTIESENVVIFENADAIAKSKIATAEAEEELTFFGEASKSVCERLGIATDGMSAFSNGMEDVSESTEAAAGPLDAPTERMADLKTAYNEAYEAALESVRGQYNLWDEAKEIIPSNLDEIGKALESQTASWESRLENLNLLDSYSGQIEGLSTLITNLAWDNSAESSNLLAGLAGAIKQGDIKKLEEFVGKFKALSEEEEKYARKSTELKEDLDGANEKLLEAMDESVAGMDRSSDAARAAHATVQAYIDEANNPDNLPEIRAAFAKLAGEAIRGLSAAARNPLYGIPAGKVTQEMLIQSGAEHYTPRAYAEGGILTVPHIGLVAEDGPEAVVPLSASRRNRGAEIWAEAGRQLGLLPAAPDTGGMRETTRDSINRARVAESFAAVTRETYEKLPEEAVQQLRLPGLVNRETPVMIGAEQDTPHTEAHVLTAPFISLTAGGEPEAAIPVFRRDRDVEVWSEVSRQLELPTVMPDTGGHEAHAAVQEYTREISAPDHLAVIQAAYEKLPGEAAQAFHESRNPVFEILPGGMAASGWQGYASGTENAERGAKPAGEDGPALTYFNGGERVLDAERAREVLGQVYRNYEPASAEPANVTPLEAAPLPSAAPVSVPVTIQVQGNASQDTVDSLRDISEQLAAMIAEDVMERIKEQQEDAAMRSFVS